jgi:serine phosphatase RsbU (regulator of sigma subunit)
MQHIRFTYWGKIANSKLEALFLKHSRHEIVSRNRIAFIIAGTGFLIVAISDFLKLGYCSATLNTLLLRLVYFIYCITLFFYFKKKKPLRLVFFHSFIFGLGYAFLINLLIYFLNADGELDLIDQLTVPLCTLLFYVFLQIPLYMLFTVGVSVTLLYFYMVHTWVKTSNDGFFILVILMLIINLLGFYLNRFLGRMRRLEFIRLSTIKELNDNLTDEIEERKTTQEKLEKIYSEMTESVRYARQIQLAILPEEEKLIESFAGHFIYYKPLEMVSGDFYWYSKTNNKIFISVADCTGHGVPGALMSMLGFAYLNEIVNEKKIHQPDRILNMLREYIMVSLHQTGRILDSKDGMDITICCIDIEEKKLSFAGAFNNIYILKDKELIELKGDKMPIGYYGGKQDNFKLQRLDLVGNESIYLFTDGIIDQFGGLMGKKYSTKRLKEQLKNLQTFDMSKQKMLFETDMDEWMATYSQIDDMLLIGIKLGL